MVKKQFFSPREGVEVGSIEVLFPANPKTPF